MCSNASPCLGRLGANSGPGGGRRGRLVDSGGCWWEAVAVSTCCVVMVRRGFLILVLGAVLAIVAGVAPARAAWGEPNGCGPGGWVNGLLGANPYNEQFEPACDLHDWCYGGAAKPIAVGSIGDWWLRKRCDDRFHTQMLATCSTTGCRAWADTYYDAVRTFGVSHYTDGQRDGMASLLPNPLATRCTSCTEGNSSATVHVVVRGANIVYWKLDGAGWVKLNSCSPWDPNHTPCIADVSLQVAPGAHVFRVKAVDYLTGALGHTWNLMAWNA
jgi:hypothetical protein